MHGITVQLLPDEYSMTYQWHKRELAKTFLRDVFGWDFRATANHEEITTEWDTYYDIDNRRRRQFEVHFFVEPPSQYMDEEDIVIFHVADLDVLHEVHTRIARWLQTYTGYGNVAFPPRVFEPVVYQDFHAYDLFGFVFRFQVGEPE